MELSVNALEVLKRRYLLKNSRGKVIESPERMFRRVAKTIASADKRYGKGYTRDTEEGFFKVMNEMEFLPNSPTLMNAGTRLGQLSACFTLPIEDSIESIFEGVKNMAKIHQSGGGTGFSFSRLRPKGDIVMSTKGIASGPVSFMRVYDTATDVIKQGGKRRGANMAILNVDHPDIIEFVIAKRFEGLFKNFNLSVAVTDKFIKQVEKDKEIKLINPRTGRTVKRIKARALFDLIIESAWKTGDPGLVFLDEINRRHALKKLGMIESTNPCLSKDMWILTKKGPFQICDIIDKKILLVKNGKFYKTRGFFSTGKKDIFNICTEWGYEIKATEDHLFLVAEKITRKKIYKKWKSLKELSSGDFLIIGNNRNVSWSGKGNFEEGYLLGLLIGDGHFSENRGVISIWEKDKGSSTMKEISEEMPKKLVHRRDFKGFQKEIKGKREMKLKALKDLALQFGLTLNKKINPVLEKTSCKFYRGFLRGFFDTDGSVQGNLKKGSSIRLWQNNLENLKVVQRMLQRIGIVSSIHKRKDKGRKLMPDGKGGKKYYAVKEGYELIISKDNISIFAKEIGFSHEEKRKRLLQILNSYKRKFNRERFVVKIKKIIKQGRGEVYDIQVLGINSFDANGFVVHNCGEMPLLPYESCNLGSINLSRFVDDGEIDWGRLREVVRTGVHFLDNVIDLNKYPMPEIKEITLANRKIGLGVMGFAEMLVKLGGPYDSEKALSIAEQVMRFVTKEARQRSIELGVERGSFPNFKKSEWYKRYKTMRNATVTTIAPTGTISIIADCSSGIEPLFAISFLRIVMEKTRMLEVNKLFEKIAKERGVYSSGLMELIARKGSVQGIKAIPLDVQRMFVTAHDIKPEWHVRMQAVFQRYTDNAVSKTVNLRHDVTKADVKRIYLLAHKLKCKGITVYRYGSKKEQVLNIRVDKVHVESEYAGGCPAPYCPF